MIKLLGFGKKINFDILNLNENYCILEVSICISIIIISFIRTHEINIQHIIHKNSVDYSQHRVYLVPIIRKQEIERRNHYSTIKNKYKRLVAEWNLTHHDDDDSSSSRGWKEDDSKRDKRSISIYYLSFLFY